MLTAIAIGDRRVGGILWRHSVQIFELKSEDQEAANKKPQTAKVIKVLVRVALYRLMTKVIT